LANITLISVGLGLILVILALQPSVTGWIWKMRLEIR